MMKLGLTLASAALALVTLSSTSRAVIVNPGDTQVPATFTTLGTGYTTLASYTTDYTAVSADPTATSPPFSGRFTTSVINEGSANALGGLTFIYDFTNNGPDAIRRLTATSFSGFITDVYYDGAGPLPGNTAPITFDRSGGTGVVVGFDFTSSTQAGVPAGSGSSYLVIRTNAIGYKPGGVSIIDGGTANIAAFAPVPEPGTMVAALVGLAAIGGLRLRRRAK